MTNTDHTMAATAHTPEPWRLDDEGFIAAGSADSYCTIADPHSLPTGDYGQEDEANARRIVAAVNACEGIATSALEQGIVSVLLEALIDLLGDRPSVQGGICQHCGRDYIHDIVEGDCPSDDCPSFKARVAIASARREAHLRIDHRQSTV